MILSRFVVLLVTNPIVRLRLIEMGAPTSFALFDVPDVALVAGEQQYLIPLDELPPIFRAFSPPMPPDVFQYVSFKISEVEILY